MRKEQAAHKVTDKLLQMRKPPIQIAVFVGKDRTSIQMTRTDSEVFEKAISARRDDFCGVYNLEATFPMISEDLAYAGFLG